MTRSILAELRNSNDRLNLRDIILGGQDGVVNVLGVTLGVAVASGDTRLTLAAGLAATFSESISMAAAAYTSSLAERDYYRASLRKELEEIAREPQEEEEDEIRSIYERFGFSGKLLEEIVSQIKTNPQAWAQEMMAHELKIAPKAMREVMITAVVVGISAVVGSFVPLTPFIFLPVFQAITASLIVSALVLFLTGVYKAKLTIGNLWKTGFQIAVIGIVSALAGYLIGVLFQAQGA